MKAFTARIFFIFFFFSYTFFCRTSDYDSVIVRKAIHEELYCAITFFIDASQYVGNVALQSHKDGDLHFAVLARNLENCLVTCAERLNKVYCTGVLVDSIQGIRNDILLIENDDFVPENFASLMLINSVLAFYDVARAAQAFFIYVAQPWCSDVSDDLWDHGKPVSEIDIFFSHCTDLINQLNYMSYREIAFYSREMLLIVLFHREFHKHINEIAGKIPAIVSAYYAHLEQ